MGGKKMHGTLCPPKNRLKDEKTLIKQFLAEKADLYIMMFEGG